MNIKIKSGILEIKTKEKYLRSFLTITEEGPCRINVWSTKKRSYTIGVQFSPPKKRPIQAFKKNCSKQEIENFIKNPCLLLVNKQKHNNKQLTLFNTIKE